MPRKHRRVIWAPKAKQDLREVWRYYARVASPEIADKLLRDIDQAAERPTEQALMWRAGDDVMPGLRSVLVHPYTIKGGVNPSGKALWAPFTLFWRPCAKAGTRKRMQDGLDSRLRGNERSCRLQEGFSRAAPSRQEARFRQARRTGGGGLCHRFASHRWTESRPA